MVKLPGRGSWMDHTCGPIDDRTVVRNLVPVCPDVAQKRTELRTNLRRGATGYFICGVNVKFAMKVLSSISELIEGEDEDGDEDEKETGCF